MTIEDPVEFLHRDKLSIINQREVGEDTASFARALRRVLRQDPDVILVGEMRDEETVRTALSAAETGHLVLSTIHTVDAAESVNRIIDFFPQAEQRQARAMLAGTLKAVISQRLVPTADGNGRVATCEILRMTGRVRDMIMNPEETGRLPEVISEGAYYGMQTFDQALLAHVQAGRVAMDDALKAATHPHDFKLLVSADGQRHTSVEYRVPRGEDGGEPAVSGAPRHHPQPDLCAALEAHLVGAEDEARLAGAGSRAAMPSGRCSAATACGQLARVRGSAAPAGAPPPRLRRLDEARAGRRPPRRRSRCPRRAGSREPGAHAARDAAPARSAAAPPPRRRSATRTRRVVRRARAAGPRADDHVVGQRRADVHRDARSAGCASGARSKPSTSDAASAMSVSGHEAVEVGVAEAERRAARAPGSGADRQGHRARSRVQQAVERGRRGQRRDQARGPAPQLERALVGQAASRAWTCSPSAHAGAATRSGIEGGPAPSVAGDRREGVVGDRAEHVAAGRGELVGDRARVGHHRSGCRSRRRRRRPAGTASAARGRRASARRRRPGRRRGRRPCPRAPSAMSPVESAAATAAPGSSACGG